MPDEFDTFYLEEDDTQEIINWALSTAAMLILIGNAPEHSNAKEALMRLESMIQATDIMWENVPEVLVQPATVVAEESLSAAIDEEQQVEELREALKDL